MEEQINLKLSQKEALLLTLAVKILKAYKEGTDEEPIRVSEIGPAEFVIKYLTAKVDRNRLETKLRTAVEFKNN